MASDNRVQALRSKRFGLGCNALGHIEPRVADAIVGASLDGGVTIFDTAAAYAAGNSESELGRCLPRDRGRVSIITKFGHPADRANGAPCSAANTQRSVEASLRRLAGDRIDCLIIHFPDAETPFEETLEAIQGLVEAGKVASYGLSNFSPPQVSELLAAARRLGIEAPVMVQEEYNLLHRHKSQALLPVLQPEGIGLSAFFPLASGLLTDAFRSTGSLSSLRHKIVRAVEDRFMDGESLQVVERVQAIADEAGVSIPTLALRWLFHRPEVAVVMAGASSASQVAANIAAWQTDVDADVVAALDDLSQLAAGGGGGNAT